MLLDFLRQSLHHGLWQDLNHPLAPALGADLNLSILIQSLPWKPPISNTWPCYRLMHNKSCGKAIVRPLMCIRKIHKLTHIRETCKSQNLSIYPCFQILSQMTQVKIKGLPRKEDLEYFHCKEMIDILGDRLIYTSLNITQCIRVMVQVCGVPPKLIRQTMQGGLEVK